MASRPVCLPSCSKPCSVHCCLTFQTSCSGLQPSCTDLESGTPVSNTSLETKLISANYYFPFFNVFTFVCFGDAPNWNRPFFLKETVFPPRLISFSLYTLPSVIGLEQPGATVHCLSMVPVGFYPGVHWASGCPPRMAVTQGRYWCGVDPLSSHSLASHPASFGIRSHVVRSWLWVAQVLSPRTISAEGHAAKPGPSARLTDRRGPSSGIVGRNILT